MKVSDFLNKKVATKGLSFEVLPPLKGNGTAQLFRTIDKLREFNPNYINITTHNSEFVYRELDNGQYERDRIRRRPGTIAIAAAIQQRYGIPVIPHTTDLIAQVNRFNEGFFADGTPMKHPGESFEYGVACYPEKHEEAPNLDMDIDYLLQKQQLGATYAVTQLFYDNQKFFDFVEKARQKGVTIPIVPGIKPFAKLSQLTVIPRTFHCDLPTALASEIVKCKTDDDARALGVEWATQQCRELYQHGVPGIHFYTVSAGDSIYEVAKNIL